MEALAIPFLPLVVDRYGLLALPRRAITGTRLAGVATLLAGVALIQIA